MPPVTTFYYSNVLLLCVSGYPRSKGGTGSLGLELQVTASCLWWVLGTKLQSLKEQQALLNAKPHWRAQCVFVFEVILLENLHLKT